ncbi:hypothetical protein [Snodgrassella gandavensis]|nr:hypothetical protein [Snodgrassella gandavensis]
MIDNFNASEYLSKVSNDTSELDGYQYRCISKTVNGETTYYLYGNEYL